MDYWHCNNASDTRNVVCEISKLDSVRFNYLFANIQLRFRNLYEFLLTDFFFRRRCRRAYCWTQQSQWAPHFQIANSFICRYLDWWCDVTWCQNHIKKFSRIGLFYLQIVLLSWRSKFNCFFPFLFFIFSSNFLRASDSFWKSFTFTIFKNSYWFQSKSVHLFDLSQIIWPIFHVKRNFFHTNATEKVHHLFVVMLDLIRSIIQTRLKFKLCIVIELDFDFVSITTHNNGSNE